MTLVAISSSYGAGGGRIAPALAERLNVPFLDRAIPAAVAEHLAVSVEDAAAHDEQMGASWLERMLRGFIGQDTGAPAPVPAGTVSPDDFRRATEEVLRRQAETGDGVILGRGAVIVLRDDARVLRVRLDGPPERRLRQAMELGGIDEDTAQRRMRQLDRMHVTYARHFYGVDLGDPLLYHVTLDSTAVPFEIAVDLLEGLTRSIAP